MRSRKDKKNKQTKNRRNITKSRTNWNDLGKGNIHVLGNIGSGHHQVELKGKKNPEYPCRIRKLLEIKLHIRDLIKENEK